MNTMSDDPIRTRRLSRRNALALGALALGGTVVAGRTSAEAAVDPNPVVLGPATMIRRHPTPVPTPPPAPAPAYAPRFVRFAFSGNTAAAGSDRWAWQGLQGDRPKPAGVPALYVYATAVQRPGDTAGITQCVNPAQVKASWFLLDPAGQRISRGSGVDYALDPGNTEFQQAAAAFLIAKCRNEGWTGVLHDEINGELSWGFAGQQSAKYPTGDSWRAALLGYVRYLAGQLNAAGLGLAGNIGESFYTAWCQDLTRAGMITSVETFVAGDVGRTGPASVEDGQWTDRLAWLEWSVANAGTAIVHDRQTDAGPVLYGLCTFLLVDHGHGVYGASTGYSAADPWMDSFTTAQALGSPLGGRVQVSPGLWQRLFQHGYVLVNSSTSATTFAGAPVAPTSGTIVRT